MTEGSGVQITDHFCSEGELPLKGREVGEEAVILKEDVQVNAVRDSESCVRGLRNTHAFSAAFYAYQCSRPTNTTVVVERTEIVVVLVQVMKSQDSRPHAQCSECMEISLTQCCCSHPVGRKVALDGQHASWDIPLPLIVFPPP